MNQILLTLIISYVLISCYFFSNWLIFSLRHPSSSPEEKFLSFVMFIIATIFWPLTIPMSLLEVFQKRKIEFSTFIPVLLVIFAFSISYYLAYLH
ncbi:hypothetical protein I8752_20520 [Nostocaceae cyanobacterium CENA369]|uniref:Uncharacterized protein n=1 Tax=Dendronalium phyllosphericum CENA369 TaxID=1725256 RepID=A0A8J7LGP7_9NOST|nr:hypothetical protein [Dendronalium phyllosphericum]MBH8575353.1 hypothetical protein [Dendronalium phyllosphericum CENA369]